MLQWERPGVEPFSRESNGLTQDTDFNEFTTYSARYLHAHGVALKKRRWAYQLCTAPACYCRPAPAQLITRHP